jgi:hypothetical protein
LKGYAGAQLSLLLYGVTGPYAELNAYLELEADIADDPWWTLWGGLEMPLGVKVEVLGHTIVQTETVVIDYRLVLAQATSNIPPNLPFSPYPADGAVVQNLGANLSWSGGDLDGDAVTYDIYFEADDTTPDVLVSNNQAGLAYDPGTLLPNTEYYWRIVAQDEHGATTTGPVWEFTTATGDMVRYAVIYGVADYPGTENDLSYTDDDAEDVYAALINDGGFQAANVRLRLDSDATSANMQSDIASWLASTVGPNDLVVFFFSGHGSRGGGTEYLVTYDGLVADVTLDTWLDTLASQQVVAMIDACHSGGFIALLATGSLPEDTRCKCLPPRDGVPRDVARDAFIKDVNQPGRVVLTASAADEYSWESSSFGHGVFTYYLLEALGTTSADTNDGNGWISAEESFDYLYPRVYNWVHTNVFPIYGDDQHPQESDGVPGEVDLTHP